jgi:NADH-quinone oxidoreductase subunit D
MLLKMLKRMLRRKKMPQKNEGKKDQISGRKNEQEDKEERKTYTLPVGPQHPMYVEAENLMVHIDGETIVSVDLNIGYMHRGIEEMMQRRNYLQNIYLSERICGICSGIHSVTYCQAVENLTGLEIPKRAEYIRTIILELERLHSHFLFLGVVGYEMGLDTVFMYTWKDREFVQDMLEEISGNRVNYAMPTVGGVRRDVSEKTSQKILKMLPYLEKRFEYYENLFMKDRTIRKRTMGLGPLPKADANKYSIQGPVLRASGVNYDVRWHAPYAAYPKIRNWKVIVEKEGDVHARVIQKILEMIEAAKILKACLERMPKGEIKVRPLLAIPEAESISLTEAPRGELLYYIRSNGSDQPERLRIRTPSFSNMLALPIMLKEQQLADLPVIVGSIDPCFSCTDRVTLVEERTGETKTVDATYLKRLKEGEKGDNK